MANRFLVVEYLEIQDKIADVLPYRSNIFLVRIVYQAESEPLPLPMTKPPHCNGNDPCVAGSFSPRRKEKANQFSANSHQNQGFAFPQEKEPPRCCAGAILVWKSLHPANDVCSSCATKNLVQALELPGNLSQNCHIIRCLP